MRAVAALVFMASLGCATTSATGPIRGTDAPVVRAEAIARELRARGYTCSVDKTDAICEAENTYKLILNTIDDPARIFVVAYFNTKEQPCSQPELQARIAAANAKSDLQVACLQRDDGATVSFGSLSMVPRNGVHSDELDLFLQHFSSVAAGVLKEQQLSELVE
ncbi:MAG: hypothetical protein WBV82_05040 [Myxococcaceae bacterium]